MINERCEKTNLNEVIITYCPPTSMIYTTGPPLKVYSRYRESFSDNVK